MLFRAALLAATLLAAPALAADPEATAAMLRDKAAGGSAGYTLLESLTTEVGQRLAGTEAEARGRDWAAAKMTALGFQNVRVETFKVPLWVRGVEIAEVTAPYPQKLIITALGHSGATPPGGIEAEVVRFSSFEALVNAAPGSLNGKIAFLDHRMKATMDGSSYGAFGPMRFVGPSIAASKGAIGVVIRSLGTNNAREPHTGVTDWDNALPPILAVTGTTPVKGAAVKPIPAGALTVPDAEQLGRMLDRGKPVRLKLVLTPQFKAKACRAMSSAKSSGAARRRKSC